MGCNCKNKGNNKPISVAKRPQNNVSLNRRRLTSTRVTKRIIK